MENSDPFSVLGIAPSSSDAEIRAAWRREAKKHHPDIGGTDEIMRVLNEALRQALIHHSTAPQTETVVQSGSEKSYVPPRQSSAVSRQILHDRSSFTIDVLPVDGFECVRLAGSILGSIIDEECPYVIEFTLENSELGNPHAGWCRCELVPEAGGTMVHLTVGAEAEPISVEHVRDCLIHHINRLN